MRLVARAVDPDKDQSYMLATVDPALLARVGFPLGSSTKAEIRAEARAAGLAAADRPESQEACFLAGDDYREFLRRHGLGDRPGAIVDEDGREVGRHDGLWRFTPGQRRGIGIAAPEPLYAVRGETATNTLVVGPRRALEVSTVVARGHLHVPVRDVDVKLRYRSAAVRATVEAEGETLTLSLARPVEGVAPGQVAVLYDDDVVVGAGLICRTRR
jgi:tRNA-specific 2-thiouridylase